MFVLLLEIYSDVVTQITNKPDLRDSTLSTGAPRVRVYLYLEHRPPNQMTSCNCGRVFPLAGFFRTSCFDVPCYLFCLP